MLAALAGPPLASWPVPALATIRIVSFAFIRRATPTGLAFTSEGLKVNVSRSPRNAAPNLPRPVSHFPRCVGLRLLSVGRTQASAQQGDHAGPHAFVLARHTIALLLQTRRLITPSSDFHQVFAWWPLTWRGHGLRVDRLGAFGVDADCLKSRAETKN